ncbi:MAG: metallophosphoesterase family protein [Spirochaetales bacterium]
MKILVVSDIHNKYNKLIDIVLEVKPDYIFFLGDGLNNFDEAVANLNLGQIFKVRGNCDFFASEPSFLKVNSKGFSFLLTHGHNFNVKNGLHELLEYAKKEGVNFVCFGHTHIALNENLNGITFFNPGSLASSRAEENSYGIIEFDDKNFTFKTQKI